MRGVVWKRKGDFDRAVADFSQAIELDPKSAMAYANRGDAWDEKGDRERALADLRAGDQSSIRTTPAPSRSAGLSSIATKGDLDRAIADYAEIIRIDPKSDDAYMRRSEAWLRRATGSRRCATPTRR